MDLGLEDEISILDVEIFGNIVGFVGGEGGISTLDEDVVLAHEGFGLVFV